MILIVAEVPAHLLEDRLLELLGADGSSSRIGLHVSVWGSCANVVKDENRVQCPVACMRVASVPTLAMLQPATAAENTVERFIRAA